jgi:CheY-like chemotaxis protein
MDDKAMTAVGKNLEPEPADRSWCAGTAASVRILYVDDEPDIREVVEISLGLDPAFVVRSCASGAEALAATSDWIPDLILLDVIMPEMDGPTTFARLAARPRTADIPVVFMTARAQASELQRLHALGAVGVIAKPFDPMTLAALVRRYAPAAETRLAALRDTFLARARADAAVLGELRRALAEAPTSPKCAGKRGRGCSIGSNRSRMISRRPRASTASPASAWMPARSKTQLGHQIQKPLLLSVSSTTSWRASKASSCRWATLRTGAPETAAPSTRHHP